MPRECVHRFQSCCVESQWWQSTLWLFTFRVNKRHYRRYIFIRSVWTRKPVPFLPLLNWTLLLRISKCWNAFKNRANTKPLNIRSGRKKAEKASSNYPFNFLPIQRFIFNLWTFHVSFGKESRNVFYPPSIKQGLRKKRNIVILPRFLQTYKSFSNRIIIDTLLNEII